jgi:uncharacterized protein DUF1572
MADDLAFAAAFLDEARRSFRGYKRLADAALDQVDDRGFFHIPDPESNSIAILVKHISGNLRSRWTDFLTTDGEKPDRDRDQEFIITPENTRQDLMQRWESAYEITFNTLQSLTPEDFSKTIYIRGDAHSILQAVNRSLNHVASHIGQIQYVAKLIKGSTWQTLSVPRGKSKEFNAMKKEDRKGIAPTR